MINKFKFRQKIDWDNMITSAPTTAPDDGAFVFNVNIAAADGITYINGKQINYTSGYAWSGNPMFVPVNKGDVISGSYTFLKFVPIYIYIYIAHLLNLLGSLTNTRCRRCAITRG
jgi:hypothetical protein